MISQILKQARKDKKLTQKDLSDKTGVGREKIAHYESGKLVPSEETIDKLASVLVLPVNKLKAAIAPERAEKRKRKEKSFASLMARSEKQLDERQKDIITSLVEEWLEFNQMKSVTGDRKEKP